MLSTSSVVEEKEHVTGNAKAKLKSPAFVRTGNKSGGK